MSRIIRVLFVDGQPREAEAARHFFQVALARHGVGVIFRTMTSLPERAQGYDLVSLGEQVENGVTSRLLTDRFRNILRQQLAEVPYLNIHSRANADLIKSYECMFPMRKINFHDKDQLVLFGSMDVKWEFPELGLLVENAIGVEQEALAR